MASKSTGSGSGKKSTFYACKKCGGGGYFRTVCRDVEEEPPTQDDSATAASLDAVTSRVCKRIFVCPACSRRTQDPSQAPSVTQPPKVVPKSAP